MLSLSKHLQIWTPTAAQTGEAPCEPEGSGSPTNDCRKMYNVWRMITINCCFCSRWVQIGREPARNTCILLHRIEKVLAYIDAPRISSSVAIS